MSPLHTAEWYRERIAEMEEQVAIAQAELHSANAKLTGAYAELRAWRTLLADWDEEERND